MACSERIPGGRMSNSPAPSKTPSNIDCGATPLFSNSMTFALASAADPSRTARSISPAASLLGLPSSQPPRIFFAARTFLRNGRSAGKSFFDGFLSRSDRPTRKRASAGPVRRAASQSLRACENCSPRKSLCGRSPENRACRTARRFRTHRAPSAAAKPTAASSTAASSQFSMASMNAWPLCRGGTPFLDGPHRPIAFLNICCLRTLEWSIAQKIGSQRSVSGDARLAR